MTVSQIQRNLKAPLTTWTPEAARVWRQLRRYHLSFGLLAATLLRSIRRRNVGKFREDDSAPKRILVIRLDALGDLILTTQVFRELKKCFPNAIMTVVVQERTKDILAANPFVDRILHPPTVHGSRLLMGLRRELSVARLYWKHLRNERFDIALNPRFGPDYYGANLLMKLIDAPASVKYVDDWYRGIAGKLNRFAFRSMTNLPRPETQHEVLTNVAGVEYLSGCNSTSRPEIFLTAEDRAYAQSVLASVRPNCTLICVGFGAQQDRKKWPLERWAEVLRLLAAHRDIFVVVICSDAEGASGKLLQSMLNVESRLVSGASVREAAACVEACDLFIGPDSGPAHIAAAVGCWPLTVSPHPLDGARDYSSSPAQWAPYADHAQIIQPPTAIPPCSEGCDAVEPHCILQISPEQVARACEVMLDSIRPSAAKAESGH